MENFKTNKRVATLNAAAQNLPPVARCLRMSVVRDRDCNVTDVVAVDIVEPLHHCFPGTTRLRNPTCVTCSTDKMKRVPVTSVARKCNMKPETAHASASACVSQDQDSAVCHVADAVGCALVAGWGLRGAWCEARV